MSNYLPVIRVANPASTSVVAGSVIPLTTAIHGNSNVLTSNGTGVTISNLGGYYKADAKITFTVPTAGNVTFSILKDGVAIATATVTAATATTYTVTIPVIILAKCCTLPNNIAISTNLAITSLDTTLDVQYLSKRG